MIFIKRAPGGTTKHLNQCEVKITELIVFKISISNRKVHIYDN